MIKYRRDIPIIYYLLTSLTCLAAAICLNGWFRQYTLFFGTHTLSTTTILVSGLLCLTLGSYITGKLSDKAIPRLTLYIIFSGIIGIYVLLHPFIFQWITALFLKINKIKNPGPLGIEILRFGLSSLVLLIPAGLLAGSLMLLLRSFIKQVGQSGRYMSATIFAGSIGILTGMLLSLLILIPAFGLGASLFLGGFMHLLTATLALSFLLSDRLKDTRNFISSKSERARKTSMRFKKKKAVLETGTKLIRAMLRVYAFQGFTLAAMLVLSFRILANYSIVKPVYFFLIIWTIVLAGLALGSALYSRISEKPVNKYMTLATLQIITGFGAIVSYAILAVFAYKTVDQLQEAKTFAGLLLKQSLIFSSFLLIPAVISGLSLPLAGKIYSRRFQKTGSNFGHLGSILFLSALTGIVFLIVLLIPFTGLHYAYLLLVFFTILSGVYLIFRDSRLIRGFRISYTLSAIILFIFVMSLFRIHNVRLKGPHVDKKIEGTAASISSVEHADGSRSVFLNGKYYFGSDKGSLNDQLLTAYLPVLMNRNIHSALVIGFGTGMTASKLQECKVSAIHIADVYPEVVRLSSDVFADDNNDIMTSSQVDITIEDARSYLIRTEGKIDLIASGINQLNLMPNHYTTNFYQICYDKLSAEGLLCQILPTLGITGIEFRSLLNSITLVFPNISLWYVSQESILMMASKSQHKIELCGLSSAFSALNANKSLTAIKIPNVESLLAHLIMDDKQVRIFIGDAPENSDNNPFVEFYVGNSIKKDNELLPLLLQTTTDYSQLIVIQGNCMDDTTEVIKQIKRLNRSLPGQDGISSGLLN